MKRLTVKRTLTYTGDEAWIRSNMERAFVQLKKELGAGRTIRSEWDPVEEVPTAGDDTT
jgi:hypothetical protein